MKRLRPLNWLRRHPLAADTILAAHVLAISIGSLWGHTEDVPNTRDPNVWGVLLAIVAAAPLAWRRRRPIEVLAVATAGQYAMELARFNGPGWMTVLIALYTVAAHTNGRRRTLTAQVFGAFAVIAMVVGALMDSIGIGEIVSGVVFMSGAFILGDNLQRRRRASAELSERAERAERERELLARQRVQDERSRIARELHDVVAHSVSLMIIQAGAARRSIATSPQQAESALKELETTGRTAMDELRRVLGVLRASEPAEALELAPQPSLAGVHALLDDSGLPVELTETGTMPDVPSSVGLSLYRVVQEALTNVRKHAGQVKHVSVHIAYEPDQIVVQVTDDGRGASVPANAEGHGLVGMRERMALCGGTVTIGPRTGGGWAVKATAPLATARLEAAMAATQ